MIRIIMRSVFATHSGRELLSGVGAFHHLLSLFEEGDSMPRGFARHFFVSALPMHGRDRAAIDSNRPILHVPGRFEDKWASMSREQDVLSKRPVKR
jgi:hypothetical protein